MDGSRFAALTPRQRECLRLVARMRQSKEIAAELGLTKSTVDTYIAEAVATIGGFSRRDAARLLAEHEASAPDRIRPDPARPDPAPDLPSFPRPSRTPSRIPLPFRRIGDTGNDLGIVARIIWIPLIALALAVAFGALSDGLRVISDLVLGRHG